MIDLGFLPKPVPLVVALGMRLNGPLAFLLRLSGHADQLEREVRLAIPGGGIEITDTVTMSGEIDSPTARFDGPAEAVVRLLSGRLGAGYATGIGVTGNVTLDELRKVFPGY